MDLKHLKQEEITLQKFYPQITLPVDLVESPSLEVLGMTLININKMYLTLSHSERRITYLSYHSYDLMILVIILLMELF